MTGLFSRTIGKWFEPTGQDSDVILTTRLRLARNIRGLRFPGRADASEHEALIQHVFEALRRFSIFDPGRFVHNRDLTPLKMRYLVERHLVPPEFAHPDRPKAVFISEDESLSIMINEEDHVRIQLMIPGLDLQSGLSELQVLDNALSGEVSFAYDERFGYLTACPTNVGTGLRASVLAHLPGLVITSEIDKVLRGAQQVGLAVRGLFGEGSETKGNLFQISNQATLGRAEEEIVQQVAGTVSEVVGAERRMRDYILETLRPEIEDKVFRAEAILRSARLLGSSEATNLLGLLRLGLIAGLVTHPTLRDVQELMILTRPANLQIYCDQELESGERDLRRAEIVRSRMFAA